MKKSVPPVRTAFPTLLCLLVVAASSATALGQSEADRKTMDKVCALYVTGPIPSSISCEVTVDWDTFFDSLKMEQTDVVKARLQKFKAIHTQVVSRGEDHTDVTLTGVDPSISTAGDGLRNQLAGFFKVYWSEAYGQFIAKRGETFQLVPTAEGYEQTANAGAGKVVVAINKASLVTQLSLDMPQLSAVIKPSFEPATDGLLRLKGAEETIEMGASKMVVDFGWDYQKVNGFDIPQHLHLALPGSFAFDYTLKGCEVNAVKPEVTVWPSAKP